MNGAFLVGCPVRYWWVQWGNSLELGHCGYSAGMPRSYAGLYGRQSAGNAASVADQHKAGEEACLEHDWSVVDRYSDLVSASRFGKRTRDDWARLGADLATGKLDIVVMWDLSRGDRTVASWAAFVDQCRERGILIHATAHGRTYDPRVPRDWRTLMDDGVEAGFDSEQKSLVVRRGTAGAAVAGKPHGAAAYGYTRVYDPHNRKKFKDVPNEQADVVREIFRRVAHEEPVSHIVNDLNGRGIPSPKGVLWRGKAVRWIATHPRYLGLRSHHGQLHQGDWEAVIDDRNVFDRCVAILSAPDRKTSPPGSKRYLLSYLATSSCGGMLAAHPDYVHRPSRYRCNDDGCISVRAQFLDEYVTRLALARLTEPDVRALFSLPDDHTRSLEAEAARLDARLEEARASFASPDGISATALATLERALQPQLDGTRLLLSNISAGGAVLQLLGEGDFTSEVAGPRWTALPLAGRRTIVKTLFDKLEVGPTTRALTRWSTPEERRLAVAERTTYTWRTVD